MSQLQETQGRGLDFRNNSLTLVRLLAACSVMYFHSTTHLQVAHIPVLKDILGYFTGVPLFFALSGYLLWQSAGRERSFADYALKRFRRIYPELWLSVGLEIAVLLVLFREPVDYWMLGLFALTQGTFLQFWTPDFLRGYGCGTPNGSLWTICVLIQFYILLHFFRKCLHGRSLRVWLGVLGISFLLGLSGSVVEGLVPQILYKLYNQTIVPYLWLFVTGMFLSEYWERLIPLLRRRWWVFLLLSLLALKLPAEIRAGNYGMIYSIALILAVLGMTYRFPGLALKRDISYGIYLYHMTVVNAMIMLGFTGKPAHLFFAMGLSCLLAWISTLLFTPRKNRTTKKI